MKYIVSCILLTIAVLNGQDFESGHSNKIKDLDNDLVLVVDFHRTSQKDEEQLTISFIKDENSNRPKLIRFSLPKASVNDNGILVSFLNDFKESSVERIKTMPPICDNDECHFIFENGYTVNARNNDTVDLYQKFKTFKFSYFSFKDRDDVFVLVDIPLLKYAAEITSFN